ncbi:hypothetical protein [Haladaptatus sp. NG-SE-30]
MPDPATGTKECPVCGMEYDRQLIVERGDQWNDLFPGTPLDFFSRYQRRCAGRYDEQRDTTVPERKRAVYFHEGEKSSPFGR